MSTRPTVRVNARVPFQYPDIVSLPNTFERGDQSRETGAHDQDVDATWLVRTKWFRLHCGVTGSERVWHCEGFGLQKVFQMK